MTKSRFDVEDTVAGLAIVDTMARWGAKGSGVIARWPAMARDGIPGVSIQEFGFYMADANRLVSMLNRLDELEALVAVETPGESEC